MELEVPVDRKDVGLEVAVEVGAEETAGVAEVGISHVLVCLPKLWARK